MPFLFPLVPTVKPRSRTSRHLAGCGLLLALALATFAPWARSAVAASDPPNVVFIISDDQAWTDYGFMGHPHIDTPNLDRLAGESLVFTRGYVPASLCSPSIASMMTGLHPRDHGIWSNDPPLPPGETVNGFWHNPAFQRERERINERMRALPTLPRLLAKQGYLAMQTGKWWYGNFSTGGFTHGMTTGRPEAGDAKLLGNLARHGDAGLSIGRTTMKPFFDFLAEAKEAEKPFLICHMPFLPHAPHNPPADLLEKYRAVAPSESVAAYWAMVEFFDRNVGEVLDALRANGLEENTIVVYACDNGWIQNPTGRRFAPKSKQSQYDGGLRTPIMIRWPGRVAPREEAQPVTSLDIMPTLLHALGLAVPANLPGIDLLDPAAVRGRARVMGDCYTHNAVNLDRPDDSLRWRWIVQGDWKLIVPTAWNQPGDEVELYNLSIDPFEETNLAAARPARATALRAALDAWWTPAPFR